MECLSTREYNVREGLSKAEMSEAQRGFKVLDFTKETKSEETVAVTGGLIYKCYWTSHTTLRRCVMICRMHQKVCSKVTHRLQQRWVESDHKWATCKCNSMEGSQGESTGARAMSCEKVCPSIVSMKHGEILSIKLLSIEISVISGKCLVSRKCQ